MAAATLVRQSRRVGNLSQRELAEAAAIHQSAIAAVEAGHRDLRVSTLERLLGASGAQLITLPTTATPVVGAADAIYDCLRRGDERRAFRHFIALADGLGREHGTVRVALCVTPPPTVGDRRFDAALAALADHRLGEEDLPRPDWVDEEWRRTEEPWVVSPFSGPELRSAVPEPFRRRGVLLDASELESV